jgi:hypothetical protein
MVMSPKRNEPGRNPPSGIVAARRLSVFVAFLGM